MPGPESARGPAYRPLTPADVPALLALQAAYYAEDGYPFDPTAAGTAWDLLLSEPRLGRAWAADVHGELVAYVVLALGFSLEYRGRDAFIDELFVAAPWRRRGLGAEALALVTRAAADLGVRALHLEVERDKPGALALYRQWGFEAHDRLLLTRAVDPDDAG